MGNIKSRHHKKKSNDKNLNIEEEYLNMKNELFNSYANELWSLDYNLPISLHKKYFDKIVTLSQSTLLGRQRTPLKLNWKDYLLNKLISNYEKGEYFYEKIINKINKEPFLFENKFVSLMFYSGIEAKFKPDIIENCEIIKEKDAEEEEINEYSLSRKIRKSYANLANLQERDICNIEEVIDNVDTNRDGRKTTASLVRLTSNSTLSLVGITDYLGGSFNLGNKDDTEDLNYEDDDKEEFKDNKKKLKFIIKTLNNHLTQDDHPIKIVLKIFEEEISEKIEKEIDEIKRQRNSDRYSSNENFNINTNNINSINRTIDSNFTSEFDGIKGQVNNTQTTTDKLIKQIQDFIIILQSCVKLFYSNCLDLQYFIEEKDELINLLTSILFSTGDIYKNIYELFHWHLEGQYHRFKSILESSLSFSPEDFGIPPKFSLDLRTKNEKSKFEAIKSNKESGSKKDDSFKLNVSIDSNSSTDNIKYNDNMSKNKRPHCNSIDCNNNSISTIDINQYKSILELNEPWNNNNNNTNSINTNNSNNNTNRNSMINNNSLRSSIRKISENNVCLANKYKKMPTKLNEIFQKFHSKYKINGFSTVIKMFSYFDKLHRPFEKIILITYIAEEIINCIDKEWEGLEEQLPITYLNITPDEFVSIFVFIIVQSQMPSLLIHEKIIEKFLTSTSTSGVIGYYNSMFNAALDFILSGNILIDNSKSNLKKTICFFCKPKSSFNSEDSFNEISDSKKEVNFSSATS